MVTMDIVGGDTCGMNGSPVPRNTRALSPRIFHSVSSAAKRGFFALYGLARKMNCQAELYDDLLKRGILKGSINGRKTRMQKKRRENKRSERPSLDSNAGFTDARSGHLPVMLLGLLCLAFA